MSLELTGMRELSVEELTLVSGGDGTSSPPPLGQIPGYTPDPSALNNIINSFGNGFANVLPTWGASPYVNPVGGNQSQWCWDLPPEVGGETVCLDPGASLDGINP